MQTPHYSVLRVRKGEETSTLSYLLPKLHEEEMAMPSDEEPAERKRREEPALAAFVMPDAPPAPVQEETAAAPTAAKAAAAPAAKVATPAQPGLLSRFFGALKNIFSGAEEAKPAEVKAEQKLKRNLSVSKSAVNRVLIIAATVTTVVITAIIVTTVIIVIIAEKTQKVANLVNHARRTAVIVVTNNHRTLNCANLAKTRAMSLIKANHAMSNSNRAVNATAVVMMTSVRHSRKRKLRPAKNR